MKKTFPLTDPKGRHQAPRVVEQIKSELRKYLKRERRKPIAEDSDIDFWDFDCRAGKDEPSAESSHVNELITAVDQAAAESWPSIYIEILAKPGKRAKRPKPEAEPTGETEAD